MLTGQNQCCDKDMFLFRYYKRDKDVQEDKELQAYLNELSLNGTGENGGIGRVIFFREGGGSLPYMVYKGTCRWTGYGFWPLCPKQGNIGPLSSLRYGVP